jgi:hypothetical protein
MPAKSSGARRSARSGGLSVRGSARTVESRPRRRCIDPAATTRHPENGWGPPHLNLCTFRKCFSESPLLRINSSAADVVFLTEERDDGKRKIKGTRRRATRGVTCYLILRGSGSAAYLPANPSPGEAPANRSAEASRSGRWVTLPEFGRGRWDAP